MKFTSHNLFPVPLFEYNLDRDYSTTEKSFFSSIKYKKNIYNSVSQIFNVLEQREMKDIKKFINNSLIHYFDNVINPNTELYPYITESWINRTIKGETHHIHAHPNSFISGVLYLSTDEQNDKITFYKKENFFNFTIKSNEYNLYNCTSWWMQAKVGTLYLFPSTLQHAVEEIKNDSVRISLSFNTFLRGTVSKDDTSLLVFN